MRVSVIGGSSVPDETARRAETVGRLLAERDHTVVCGGLTGVMEAVCRGAQEANGETIGIVPSENRSVANEYVTTPIATGLGHARNALVVLNGDAVIAIDGGPGTLSELGLAGAYGRPIAGLGTHDVGEITGQVPVETPEAAVSYIEAAID